MQLGEYHKIRTGVQRNAHRADVAALTAVQGRLELALQRTGLFHSVEIGHTQDIDRLLIAMVGFDPSHEAHRISGALQRLWLDKVGYEFWSAHHVLADRGHVELQAASREGAGGHYVTLHVIAQASTAPAAVPAPVPAHVQAANAAMVAAVAPVRGWGRRFGRPAVAQTA